MVKTNTPVVCNSCGHEFKREPQLEVSCPTCYAKPGQFCKRPSGHQGPLVPFHQERDLATLAAGYYDHNGNDTCGPNSGTPRANAILRKYNFKCSDEINSAAPAIQNIQLTLL